MRQYIIKRLLMLIPVLFFVSLAVFTLMRFIPGDAALLMVSGGEDALSDPEVAEALRKKLGLNKPAFPITVPLPRFERDRLDKERPPFVEVGPVKVWWNPKIEVSADNQYTDWMFKILTKGDLGKSFWTEEPVMSEILKRLPVTLELAIGAMIITVLVAIPTGVISAIRQDTGTDYVARFIGLVGIAAPGFWIGTLLIVFPAIWWGYLPPLGYVEPWVDPWSNFRQFIFPCLALGFADAASNMRMTRSQMLEVLRQDYIRTAWAKGLRERMVIFRHALRNAMIPVLTLLGIDFGRLLGRTVIMETVFALPGVGTLTLRSIFQRDYPQIQGNVLFIALIFVSINLVVDIAYAWFDPRIRYS